MRVLVACEFSGVVRDAFRRRGHEAWSCDLLGPDDMPDTFRAQQYPNYHLEGDVRWWLTGPNAIPWDLMIAHPPCTYLTNAGVRHLHSVPSRRGAVTKVHGEARFAAMREAAGFFNELRNAPIPRVCVENPIPHKFAREIIGRYTQLIQPWMFGHGETKGTGLWLRGLPRLHATHKRDNMFYQQEPSERVPRIHMTSPSPDRWKKRSITYSGIAEAMAEQWG